MLHLAAGLTGTPQLVLCFLLQAASSCFRLSHFQRSQLVADHDSWLEFQCSEGKSPTQGVRPLTGGRLRVCIGEHLMCWLFSENFIRVPCFRAAIFCGRLWSCRQLTYGKLQNQLGFFCISVSVPLFSWSSCRGHCSALVFRQSWLLQLLIIGCGVYCPLVQTS